MATAQQQMVPVGRKNGQVKGGAQGVQKLRTVKVRSGDTLADIARDNG